MISYSLQQRSSHTFKVKCLSFRSVLYQCLLWFNRILILLTLLCLPSPLQLLQSHLLQEPPVSCISTLGNHLRIILFQASKILSHFPEESQLFQDTSFIFEPGSPFRSQLGTLNPLVFLSFPYLWKLQWLFQATGLLFYKHLSPCINALMKAKELTFNASFYYFL